MVYTHMTLPNAGLTLTPMELCPHTYGKGDILVLMQIPLASSFKVVQKNYIPLELWLPTIRRKIAKIFKNLLV